METEEKSGYKCIVIYPSQVVSDVWLGEIPITGHRITIEGKSYRIVEAHESMVHKGHNPDYPDIWWDYCCTLGN